MIRRDDGSWLLDGSLAIGKFKELVGIQELPDEGKYHTLAGLVLAALGQIPISGTHFELSEWLLEVVDIDGPRVDKVLVRVTAEAAA